MTIETFLPYSSLSYSKLQAKNDELEKKKTKSKPSQPYIRTITDNLNK